MNITFNSTELDGLILVHSSAYNDNRGWLRESYNKEIFCQNGITEIFLQEKNSFSKRNVMRGLHLQTKPNEQGKLVKCTFGSIFDVVVDVRKESKTYGKWWGIELTDSNGYQLYVPPGFAHGFVVTSDNGAMFSYHITHNHFSKEHDGGIYFNDPEVGIEWPIPIEDMIVSEKDQNLPMLKTFSTYESR
jgi:dTDP-4-dehydrorhamnose 3,5-epimerase